MRTAPVPPTTTNPAAAHATGFLPHLASQEYCRPLKDGSVACGGSAEPLDDPVVMRSPPLNRQRLSNISSDDDHCVHGIFLASTPPSHSQLSAAGGAVKCAVHRIGRVPFRDEVHRLGRPRLDHLVVRRGGHSHHVAALVPSRVPDRVHL